MQQTSLTLALSTLNPQELTTQRDEMQGTHWRDPLPAPHPPPSNQGASHRREGQWGPEQIRLLGSHLYSSGLLHTTLLLTHPHFSLPLSERAGSHLQTLAFWVLGRCSDLLGGGSPKELGSGAPPESFLLILLWPFSLLHPSLCLSGPNQMPLSNG